MGAALYAGGVFIIINKNPRILPKLGFSKRLVACFSIGAFLALPHLKPIDDRYPSPAICARCNLMDTA